MTKNVADGPLLGPKSGMGTGGCETCGKFALVMGSLFGFVRPQDVNTCLSLMVVAIFFL